MINRVIEALRDAMSAPNLERLERVAADIRAVQVDAEDRAIELQEERKELVHALDAAEADWHEVKEMGSRSVPQEEWASRQAAYESALDDLRDFDAAHQDELQPWGMA